MITNFKPLQDRILVKPIDLGEQKKGSILIPDMGEEKVRIGKVIAVGPGKMEFGAWIETKLQVGQVVVLPKLGALRVEVDGKELWTIAEKEVIATAEIVEE